MGEVFELRSGDYRARVDRVGAGLQALTWRDHDLVWPYTGVEGPQAFQGQLLAPWPNRVAGGRYAFQGTEYRLEVDNPETGSAIHGLVHDQDWNPVDASEDEVTLRLAFEGAPGYPFPLELTARYRLSAEGLTVSVKAVNTGEADAPYGVGFHPYLTLGRPLDELSARGALTVSSDAESSQPTDENLIPVGAPVPVSGGFDLLPPGRDLGDTVLDTAFTDLRRDERGRAWVRLGGPEHRVALWAGTGYEWLQLFSADTLDGDAHRAHLAAEPMTCPPNAFNSGTDLLVLSPGQAVENDFGILAEPRVG